MVRARRVPKAELSRYTWIYYPDPDVVFQRLTDFSQMDADMVPEGQTGIVLEIAAFPGDETWQLSDEQIVERVREDLARVGMVDRGLSCKATVSRNRYVYPLQTIGRCPCSHPRHQ